MQLVFKVNKNRKRGRHTKRRFSRSHHVQEWLWPTIGWRGLLRLMEIRIKRMPDSTHSVALGLALGVFISFTPFVGLHLAFVIIAGWLLRSSIVAGWIGTLVGNPWTFPVIWLWTHRLGQFILGRDHTEAVAFPKNLSFSEIIANFASYWDSLLLPMTVGGIPTGLIAGFVVYWVVRVHVVSYRKARKIFLERRRKEWHERLREKAIAIKEKVEEIRDK